MITTNGQQQQLKLLAGTVYKFADLFVVGASNAVLPASANQLDFAWATTPVIDAYVDTSLNQVVYHGTLDKQLAGDINEIGLISLNSDFVNSGLPNSLVYTFEAVESWFSDGNYSVVNSSAVGANNVLITNATANQRLTKVVNEINVTRYDTFKLRLINAGVTQIQVRMMNDESNYIYKNFTLTAGLNSIKSAVNTFTQQGVFNAKNVQEIRITINSVSSPTNTVEFDALTLSSDLNGGLVTRTILANTQYKRQGASQEIEIAVALNG